jgi:predicted HTH transcriptional regulator
VLKSLWDGLNNPQRVNVNLLRDADVETLDVEGKAVIRISVPRARRQDRPVYIAQNMFTGTFRRNNEGDYRCPEEVVRRMVAEQVDDSRDARVLVHYGMDDLDPTTIAGYRRRYQTRLHEHPWTELGDREFLQRIGAFGADRESGKEGLTAGGLLMFGKMVSIKDAFPNYMLDYQERTAAGSEPRWVDRLTTDGSWSGNVFDFYGLVIQRLFRDLKVPFMLRGDTRIEETPVHEAVREALVNTIIHADYTGRTSLLVVKRPDSFVFRNPGGLRLPIETVLRGGESDCRNRRLQDMFRYLGLGEQAGSGIPKIQAAWKAQHWRAPELADQVDPNEQTVFTLRMVSLLPADVVEALEREYGRAFAQASEIQKLALVTAAVEHSVNHARLQSMTAAHPRAWSSEACWNPADHTSARSTSSRGRGSGQR